ncbi:MAG: NADH-quinone oxidoreductase subunit C [Gaiellaceae bacterium]
MRPVLVTDAQDPYELLQPRLAAVVEDAPAGERRLRLPLAHLDAAAGMLLERRGRLVAMSRTEWPEPSLVVAIAFRGELVALRAPLEDASSYQALSRFTPAARLPERELRDLYGLEPLGHPAPEPLLRSDADRFDRRVIGAEAFTIPYGPIRSGVFESIQYVVETGGEDVLALQVRPFFKHRGLERRFGGLPYEHAAQLAERVAGIAAVAHASAFAQSVERALGVEPTRRAQRWRVVHAELERIANHLDVAIRLAEDAAVVVGAARFGILKEDVMRLRARLCGSRFGRGVVVPGGIAGPPLLAPAAVLRALDRLEHDLRRDRRLLLKTTSFTDRLIGSGRLDRATVEAYAGVGPVARASGVGTDARFERPYGAYVQLGERLATADAGDAMARLQVRFDEIDESLHLIRQAFERLDRYAPELRAELPAGTGAAFGWVEAPMGELVYWVEVAEGRVRLIRIASPSLRNWPLFAESFRGDVLTDFSFIEHSFGLTQAGADR